MSPRLRTAAAALVLAAPLVALTSAGTAAAAPASSYATLNGGGSTWSQIALDSWRADLRQTGLVVNYDGQGSTAGRRNYIQNQYDFAVSEIPFQDVDEAGFGSEIDQAAHRPYAYLPIVAGGTSFMYNLSLGGRRITDLRLSGETVTRIFTGAITRWNDPRIVREYGRPLPNVKIVPVVRSDGSGTSAQFSLFMSTRHASIWDPFCRRYLRNGNCRFTSFYPTFPGAKAQAGSNGVSNYVAASYGNGAIAYVEYGYARQLNFPVVKVLNAAGYYTLPTAGNVAVALTRATINRDLTQNLNGVYANTDRRTYPLSSYSYMIVPTSPVSPFNAGKGRSLSTFVNYFLCEGQQRADALGYSPLPENLVRAGFAQVNRIPGRVAPPALTRCNNPALRILQTAPQPPACDSARSAPCGSTGTGNGSGSGNGSGNGSGTGSGSGTGTGSGSGSGSGAGSGSGSGAGSGNGAGNGGGAGTGTGSPTPAPIDPETGLPGGGTGDGSGTPTDVYGVPVELAASREDSSERTLLYALTGVELLAAILLPPLLVAWLRRRRSGQT